MSILKKLIPVILLAVAVNLSSGAWVKILDCEEGTLGAVNMSFSMSGAGGPLDNADGAVPDIGFVEGPVDAGNHVFLQDALTYGVWWNAYHTYIPLPAAAVIPDGEQGTLYFKIYHETGLDNGGMDIGVTTVPFEPYDYSVYTGTIAETDFVSLDGEQLVLESRPNTWSDFSVQFDIDNGSNSLKNADGFHALDLPTPPVNEWEEYWIYIDNAADIYNVYTRSSSTGGAIVEANIIPDIGDPFPDATFVASTDQPIIAFYYGTSAGSPGAASAGYLQYHDDYYMYRGGAAAQLETPVPDTGGDWCGMTVAAGDYVDTGSWLEWIYVGLCPNGAPGWVYSVNLNSWIYVSGCPGGAGAWVYVPN
jgi:hypothetical protein